MKFAAYNTNRDYFFTFEVDDEGNIPGYFWENSIVASDDDFRYWQFYEISRTFNIQVEVTYNIKD